jgi:hypothetical protein
VFFSPCVTLTDGHLYEQVYRSNAERFGQPSNDENGRVSQITLNAADVGAMQTRTEGEFLLRPALAAADSPSYGRCG